MPDESFSLMVPQPARLHAMSAVARRVAIWWRLTVICSGSILKMPARAHRSLAFRFWLGPRAYALTGKIGLSVASWCYNTVNFNFLINLPPNACGRRSGPPIVAIDNGAPNRRHAAPLHGGKSGLW